MSSFVVCGLGCALALVVLFLGACHGEIAPRLLPTTPLLVTTFNLRVDTDHDGDNRWDLRKDLAAEVITDLAPDILGTQEPLLRQVNYLEEKMPAYQRIGGGRGDGKNEGEFAALFLKKSRFDVQDSGTFWLSPTPEAPGSKGWDAAYPRVATWALVTDKATHQPVMILNTHLDNKGQEARLQAAKMIHEWLRNHASGKPTIFLGDLNSHEDAPALHVLLEPNPALTLFDAYRIVHPERQKDETTLGKFRGQTEGSRIDFILHSAHFQPTNAAIIRTAKEGHYPSDHYPVSVTLRWK